MVFTSIPKNVHSLHLQSPFFPMFFFSLKNVRFQGQKGNVDSGSKPKSELAQVMNKGIMEQRPLE